MVDQEPISSIMTESRVLPQKQTQVDYNAAQGSSYGSQQQARIIPAEAIKQSNNQRKKHALTLTR